MKLDDRVIYRGPIPLLADEVGTVLKGHCSRGLVAVRFDMLNVDWHAVPEQHLVELGARD